MSDIKTIFKDLIKDYCAHCSFAGLHYIADDAKHWIERLLWVLLVILSWYGSALLIIAAVEAFVQSPISFGVDTVYLDWDTKMPAVGICETKNKDKIDKVSDELWPNSFDLYGTLAEIAYYRGVSIDLAKLCYVSTEHKANCFMSNYSYIANLVRSDCNTILRNCSYNGVVFPCCDYFLPLETDMGTCLVINSVQTKKQNPYPMVLNMKNQQGSLKFRVFLVEAMVYTLGDDEVPTITTSSASSVKVEPHKKFRRSISIRNIENDALLWETNTKQRACRFHHENEGGLYPKYSYSACTVLCRKKAQMHYCKCYDHFMPNTTEAEHCNITGMACLNGLTSILTSLKPAWAHRPGLSCDCLPSCDETEITIIMDSNQPLTGRKKTWAEVVIELPYIPSERFKRNVVRSRQDLVVSIGGTTGLFVGASILSFVELFCFFTVRLCNNLWTKRKKNRHNNITLVKSKKRSVAIHLEEMDLELKNFRKYLP